MILEGNLFKRNQALQNVGKYLTERDIQKLTRWDAQLCNSSAASVLEILMHRDEHERNNISVT